MSGRAVKRAVRGLAARIESFEAIPASQRGGMKRPGSLNPHKSQARCPGAGKHPPRPGKHRGH